MIRDDYYTEVQVPESFVSVLQPGTSLNPTSCRTVLAITCHVMACPQHRLRIPMAFGHKGHSLQDQSILHPEAGPHHSRASKRQAQCQGHQIPRIAIVEIDYLCSRVPGPVALSHQQHRYLLPLLRSPLTQFPRRFPAQRSTTHHYL
jgi:hypothetical protein